MNNYEVILQTCAAFCSLIPSQLSELARGSRKHHLQSGTRLFESGDPASHVYLLSQGHLQLCHRDERGRRAIVRSVWPRDLFGESALTPSGVRYLSCDVARDSCVLSIAVAPLKTLMMANPQLAMDVVGAVTEESLRISQALVATMLHSKRRRLIGQLETLARTQGALVANEIILPLISHQELSEMIGASRETVTTVLGQLRSQRVLRFDGRKIVIDRSRFPILSGRADDGTPPS